MGRGGAVLLALVLAGCSDSLLGPRERLDLVMAEKVWKDSEIESYTYEIRQLCFCVVEVTRFVRVEVRNDSVVAATDVETGSPMPQQILPFWPTVDELFEGLRTIREGEGVTGLTVEFDRTYGYPRFIRIVTELPDGGGTVTARALVPLRP